MVRLDDPCWSARLLRSTSSLRQLPALAKVYIAEPLTRTQQAGKTALQPRFDAAQQLGLAFYVLAAEHPALMLLSKMHASQFDFVPNSQGYDCTSKPRPQAQQARRDRQGEGLQSLLLTASDSKSGIWPMMALTSSLSLLQVCSCQMSGQHIWQCATCHRNGHATATLRRLMTCRGFNRAAPGLPKPGHDCAHCRLDRSVSSTGCSQ